MAASDETLRPDELLAQLGWVRALAARLVADPHVTDDVLQQVCLLAMQQAPREARAGPRLRAWLATVTRNLARNAARADGRRLRREQAAARPEAQPATVDVAAHREALRRLVDAVTSLEEPYYSAVVARYFEGREVAEIASQQGVSAEAMRQRLSRAREKLRARLQSLLADDREGWLRAVLPVAPASMALEHAWRGHVLGHIGGTLVAKSVGAGGIAKVVVGLVIVACLVLGTWYGIGGGRHAPAPPTNLDRADTVANEREPAAPQLPAPTAAAPTPLVAEAVAADPARAPSAAALPGEAALFTGRVVDENGAPIAGAVVSHVPTVTLRRPLDLLGGPSPRDLVWDRLPQTTTGKDGRFSFASREIARDPDAAPEPALDDFHRSVIGGGTPGLVVRHPDHELRVHVCTTFRSGAYDAGDIVLASGQVAIGRLVAATGGAVSGADVGLQRDMVTQMVARTGDAGVATRLLHVSSGADGRFRLGSLGPGDAHLEVNHGDFVPWGTRMNIVAGSVLDLGDIELKAARHIRGVVVGADGQPLRDAQLLARGAAQRLDMLFGGADPLRQEFGSSVGLGTTVNHEVRLGVDATGAFDLGTLDQTYYDVFADAPGHDPACLRDVQAGTDGLVLTLPEQATLLLTAVDATSHAALAGATANAWRRSENKGLFGDARGAELQVAAGAAVATAAGVPGGGADAGAGDGLILVQRAGDEGADAGAGDGLILVQRAGDEGTDVVLSAPGHATTGFALPGVRPGQQLARTLALGREAVLEGRVQDAGGQPVADAHLELRWPKDAGVELPPRKATSDAEGRFRLDQLLPGAWTLTAVAQGFLDQWSLPQPVADVAAPQQTVITLDRGASLQGLLLDADGAPAPQADIEVTSLDVAGKGRRFHATSDGNGRFSFDVLPPGLVRVTASPGAEGRVTLTTGATQQITLALRHLPVVHGRVMRAGQPVEGATVAGLVAPPSTSVPNAPQVMFSSANASDVKATTSATGEYVLEFKTPGAHVVRAKAENTWSRAVAVTTDWDRAELVDIDLAGVRLAGLVTDARTQQPVAHAAVTLHDRAQDDDPALAGFARASELDAHAETDAQGRFAFERVPPGAVVVSVRAAGYADARLIAQLPADGPPPADLAFALEPGTALKGTVRMASGKPLWPDLRVGLETGEQAAQDHAVNVRADGTWVWQESLAPGPCTVKLWRDIATQLGALAPKDVLASVPVSLVAGETKVVELVIND